MDERAACRRGGNEKGYLDKLGESGGTLIVSVSRTKDSRNEKLSAKTREKDARGVKKAIDHTRGTYQSKRTSSTLQEKGI